jgi:hypothetical protein
MMVRTRKLIGMSQDDLSSFRPSARPQLFVTLGRWFKAQIEVGEPVTHPDAGDICM